MIEWLGFAVPDWDLADQRLPVLPVLFLVLAVVLFGIVAIGLMCLGLWIGFVGSLK